MDTLDYKVASPLAAWRELFSTYCAGYGVKTHLKSPTKTPSELSDAEWNMIDNVVKSWLYGTLSQNLLNTILKS